MGKLDKAGIKVFIASGNHDAASRITKAMPLPGNVTLFSHKKPQSVMLEEFGVTIHGQSYPSRSVTENLVSHYPQYDPHSFNIGLLHSSLTGREGHENYAPCTIHDLHSKGYDYWALGHVHKKEVLHEDPLIVFPGNIQGRHIRECGPRGCMRDTVDDIGRASADFRPIDVIRWMRCEVDASGADRGDDVVDRICEQIKELLEQSSTKLEERS